MIAATTRAFALRSKLQALSERGIAGERESALKKLARLESRYDFSQGDPEGPNLFEGNFEPSGTAIYLASFGCAESRTAGFIKWAIERRTGISGVWRYSPCIPTASRLPLASRFG